MKLYLKALKQYIDFDGRATKTEFWLFELVSVAILVITILLDNLLDSTYLIGEVNSRIGIISIIFTVYNITPAISIAVRRLHDVGKPGRCLLLVLIPIAGIFILTHYWLKEGQNGINWWGKNPDHHIE